MDTNDLTIAPNTATERLRKLAAQRGVLRPRDLDDLGLPRSYLHRLWLRGELQRVGRGLYLPVDHAFTEHHGLVEACQRVPHGVVCLLSALRFHELGTQSPNRIWLAIPQQARKPQTDLPLEIAWFSGAAYTSGLEEHVIEGVEVRVYSVAKTLADCFKYRHKIGIDSCTEALKDAWRQRRFGLDELQTQAAVCRVQRVLQPYLEMLP